MKQLMLGNEAIARGAYEAGVKLVSSYPGTPSTEITEACAKYPEMYVEWAANEKVAVEVAIGFSMGGSRALSCMKHVGLNVAADPLYTVSYSGATGGLVVVVADDPGMHSSQNEQDSRMHARAAMLPMLEPSDSQECKDFVALAYEISRKYDTPVLLRTTTRIAHARSLVTVQPRTEAAKVEYQKNAAKRVMMPAFARPRHVAVEARMTRLAADATQMAVNRIEPGDPAIGVICSGIVYQFVKETLPQASVLKLGLVNPLPVELIRRFAESVDQLYIFEELEPVIEEQVRALGISIAGGKAQTGRQGELSARRIREIMSLSLPEVHDAGEIPGRPPVMCAGCPHRGPFYVLKKLKKHVTGDIGCYTLGALPPLNVLDSQMCMGASIGMAQGFTRAGDETTCRDTVAVIGDSTFLHSGVPSLISAAYNGADITVMILDNTTTGMTGHQPNPASGVNLYGENATRIDLLELCRACGAEHVRIVDSFDLAGVEQAVREEADFRGLSVIIARRPCMMLSKHSLKPALHVAEGACRGCMACMNLGCPAIEKSAGHARINEALCVGCSLCVQVCAFGAIGEAARV